MMQLLRSQLQELEAAGQSNPAPAGGPVTASREISTPSPAPEERRSQNPPFLPAANEEAGDGGATDFHPATAPTEIMDESLQVATPLAVPQTPPSSYPSPRESQTETEIVGRTSVSCDYFEPRGFERLMKPLHPEIDVNCLRSPSSNRSIQDKANERCMCDTFLDAERWCLPLRRAADNLISVYFTRVHRMYPILHRPTFSEAVQAVMVRVDVRRRWPGYLLWPMQAEESRQALPTHPSRYLCARDAIRIWRPRTQRRSPLHTPFLTGLIRIAPNGKPVL